MVEKYELAEKDYMAGMKYKDIADKYDVSINTVKSWKTRHKWSKYASQKSVHTKPKRVHTNKEVIEPVVEPDELTEKQRLFCIYYIKSFNQTTAAIKAGYSPDRAHVTGSELVRNRKVAEEIRRLKGEMQQGIFIDAMDVINKYIQIAFADITEYIDFTQVESEAIETNVEYNPDGSKKSEKTEVVPYTYTKFAMHRSDQIDGTLITELSKGKDGMFKVKLADKMKALEMLAKYMDLLSDNDKKRLQEEKLKADIAKTRSETKGTGNANISVVDFGNLSTEELRAIANSKR